MPIVYQTDPATGEYRGPLSLDDGDISPCDPGTYLIPGGCVIQAPPEVSTGHASVWRGEAWEVVEDHRGATVYLDGAEIVVADLGPLPEGAATERPLPTEANLWSSLRAERDARLIASDVYVWADRWAGYTDAARAAWTDYRQALRDLPENTADPANPAWPEVPQ